MVVFPTPPFVFAIAMIIDALRRTPRIALASTISVQPGTQPARTQAGSPASAARASLAAPTSRNPDSPPGGGKTDPTPGREPRSPAGQAARGARDNEAHREANK